MNQEERIAKWGWPERLPDDELNVLVWKHTEETAARLSIEANLEMGHVARYENRNGTWVSIVDIRPEIERLEREYRKATNGGV